MAAPLINGVNYSWSNITWVWYTLPLIGIKSINYEAKQSKYLNYGNGTEPTSEGVGNKEYTASIEIYLDEWNKIIEAAPNNDPMLIIRSDMQIVYGGDRVNSKLDVLKSVSFMNDPVSVKQGDGSVIVKVELSVAGLTHKR